jgi:DNA polymerase IV
VLDPLPVRRLSGLGPKTAPRVEALGIHTLGELRRAKTATLRPVFGRYAERVQQRAAGIDDRPVVPDIEELQISAEETFDTDIADHAQLHAELTRLADRSAARLRARRLVAACVVIKIRRKDFTTYTRQRHIEPPTQETRVIAKVAAALLDAWLGTQPTAALRLLGVGVSQLSPALQMELFATPESERNQQLDQAVDDIRDRFGRRKLTRASSLDPK